MSNRRYVAYYRVSTVRQGRSGLGLEGQRTSVLNHLNGGNRNLLAEFTEVESGTRCDRPKLTQALAACRIHQATLVIAKLDRLARNVAFISNLLEAGVEFEAVDFPQANRLTIHILAAIAEHEARIVSERTRTALRVAKGRGTSLGGFRGRPGTKADCQRALAARQAKAIRRAADLYPVILSLQESGYRTLRSIAVGLNEKGIKTLRGGVWSAAQVRRIIQHSVAKSARDKPAFTDVFASTS